MNISDVFIAYDLMWEMTSSMNNDKRGEILVSKLIDSGITAGTSLTTSFIPRVSGECRIDTYVGNTAGTPDYYREIKELKDGTTSTIISDRVEGSQKTLLNITSGCKYTITITPVSMSTSVDTMSIEVLGRLIPKVFGFMKVVE